MPGETQTLPMCWTRFGRRPVSSYNSRRAVSSGSLSSTYPAGASSNSSSPSASSTAARGRRTNSATRRTGSYGRTATPRPWSSTSRSTSTPALRRIRTESTLIQPSRRVDVATISAGMTRRDPLLLDERYAARDRPFDEEAPLRFLGYMAVEFALFWRFLLSSRRHHSGVARAYNTTGTEFLTCQIIFCKLFVFAIFRMLHE